MYDKAGSVLRVETTLAEPKDFKVLRPRQNGPEDKLEWRPLRKGVADLHLEGTSSPLPSSPLDEPPSSSSSPARPRKSARRTTIPGSSRSGAGELRWRSAAPGSTARVPLAWGFDDYAINVLGDRPRIVLDLRIGEEEHQLEIEYERIE
jgi:hypothetical protein